MNGRKARVLRAQARGVVMSAAVKEGYRGHVKRLYGRMKKDYTRREGGFRGNDR